MRHGAPYGVQDTTASWQPASQHSAARPAAPSLSLPQLAAGARLTVSAGRCQTKLAALGLALMDAGMLRSADLTQTRQSAILRGLQRWLESIWGGLKWFKFMCHITDTVLDACGEDDQPYGRSCTDAALSSAVQKATGVALDERHLALAFTVTDAFSLTVADGVTGLEDALPGLGWAALDAVESIGCHFDLFGFGWAESTCSYTHWGGYDKEEDWLDEMGVTADEYDGITRAVFNEHIPIATMRASKAPTPSQLRKLARQRNTRASAVARCLLRLAAINADERDLGVMALSDAIDWFGCTEPTVLLGWKTMGLPERLFDDHSQMVMESGERPREVVGVAAVALDRPDVLQELAQRWKPVASRLKLVDQLLTEIATPAHSNDKP